MPPRSPSHAFDPTPALEHDPDNFSPLNREAVIDNSTAYDPVRAVHFSDVPVPVLVRHSIATTTVPLMSSVAPSTLGMPQQAFRIAGPPTGINMTEYIDSCRSLNEQLRQAHETERKAWNIERSALQARIADLEFRLNRGRDSKRRSSNDSSAASAQSFRSDFRTMYDMSRPSGSRKATSSEAASQSSVPPVWKGPEATPPVTRIFSSDDSDVNHLAPISEDAEAFPPLTKEISPRTKSDGPPIDVSLVDSTLEGIALKSSGPAITSSFVTKITSPQFNSSSDSPSPPSANRPPSNTLSSPPNNLNLDPNALLDPLDKKLKLHAGHTPLAVDDALSLSEIPTEVHTPKPDIPPEAAPEAAPTTRPPVRPSENSDSYFSFVDIGSQADKAQEAPILEEAAPQSEQPLEPEPTLEPEHDQPLKGPLMLDPSARSTAANVFLEQVDAKLSEVAASSRFRSDTITTQGSEPGPDAASAQAEDSRAKENEDKAEFSQAQTETSLDGLPKLKMKMSTNFGSAWGGDMPGRI